MPQAQTFKSTTRSNPTITSRENRWLKTFRASLRDDAPEDGIVAVEGPHLVEEAIRAGLEITAVLVSPGGEAWLGELRSKLPQRTQILTTTDKLFESIASTRAPQGLAALVRVRRGSFDDMLISAGVAPLVVVLVAVQDPGNVGTVIRAAEGFGASGAIVATGSADPWQQKSLRASAGSALRLPVLTGVQAARAMAQLRVAGFTLVAAASGEGEFPSRVDLRGPVALLIGNEGAGLPAEVLRSANVRVRIPLAEQVESLNAAMAASVLLYEAARQRGQA